jgi:hypothetical protein
VNTMGRQKVLAAGEHLTALALQLGCFPCCPGALEAKFVTWHLTSHFMTAGFLGGWVDVLRWYSSAT